MSVNFMLKLYSIYLGCDGYVNSLLHTGPITSLPFSPIIRTIIVIFSFLILQDTRLVRKTKTKNNKKK